MRPFTAIEGSPIEGRLVVERFDRAADENDATFAERVDASLPEADGILCAPWTWCVPRLTPERWATARHLKVIAGAFSDRFQDFVDPQEARGRGVALVDTSRAMSPTVAEFGLAMILNLLRDIPAAIDLMRAGGWKAGQTWDQPGFVHGDLAERRVGLAGFGAIGQRLAELLIPFRCDVSTFDPWATDSALAGLQVRRAANLVDLVRHCDIVVITVPPRPGNEQVIDADVIGAIPRGGLLVLLSRMIVIDQEALWRRAEAGEIRVAVDVFAPEPPPATASFRSSPWVLPTPHVAGATADCHRRCFNEACAGALAALTGGASAWTTNDWPTPSGRVRLDRIACPVQSSPASEPDRP